MKAPKNLVSHHPYTDHKIYQFKAFTVADGCSPQHIGGTRYCYPHKYKFPTDTYLKKYIKQKKKSVVAMGGGEPTKLQKVSPLYLVEDFQYGSTNQYDTKGADATYDYISAYLNQKKTCRFDNDE